MTERLEARGLPRGVVVGLALGIVLAWVLAWILTVAILGRPDGPGSFGDMFGSVNALFSGLALAGVVLTLFMQHHELGLQRKELALTREQLERTASAQEASEAALARQARANERAAEIAGLVAVVDHYRIRITEEGQAGRRLDLMRERNRHIDALADLIASRPEPNDGTT